jgi:hypothetical protein
LHKDVLDADKMHELYGRFYRESDQRAAERVRNRVQDLLWTMDLVLGGLDNLELGAQYQGHVEN